jgi:hypothetical protein
MGLRLPRLSWLAAAFCAAVAITLAGTGGAGAGSGGALAVGIASDEPYVTNDGGSSYYGALRAMGMTTSRLVVVWHPDNPMTIYDRTQLDHLVETALANGLQPFFNVTQSSPSAFSSPDNRAQFSSFVQLLAHTYPQVGQYVIGNEPNVTYFWRPQFNEDDSPRAPSDFVDLLARSYDALKAVNPNIQVIAGGLDARGNDNPDAPSNISNSPVRFIAYMGQAYRAGGRTRPLFDAVSFHPYPQSARDPYTRSYAWPNAGVADLDRLKQAYWDAFRGTAQPTFEEGLKFNLDETGWQTSAPADHAAAYNGNENNQTTDESTQAQIYGDLIKYLECDSSVQSVLFYRLMDESDLTRWQSGVLRADGSYKPSYDAVRQTIAQTGGRCSGQMRAFQHVTGVLGAAATFQIARKPARATAFSFTVTAEEGASAEGRILRVPSPKGLSRAQRALVNTSFAQTAGSVANGATKVQARWAPVVKFPAQRLKTGWYVYAVKLSAELNPDRTSAFVSGAFRVG